MSTTPQPGWYPDPSGSGGERYWDGSSWGQDTRVAGPGPQVQDPYAQPSAGGYGANGNAYGSAYGTAGSYGGYAASNLYGRFGGEAVAAWGWRVLAYILDALILMVPLNLLLSVVTPGGAFAYENSFRTTVITVIVWAVYKTAMVATRGASLGQLLLGMRVAEVDANGDGAPSWSAAAIRGISAPIIFATGIGFLVNGLMPLFTKDNQAIHDMIAKTVVLKRR